MKKLVLIILIFFAAVIVSTAETEKKKIVFIKDDDGDFWGRIASAGKEMLEKKGWNNNNSDYIILSMEGKEENSGKIISKIREVKPDVVFMNTTMVKNIAMQLNDDNIPCVAGGGLEMEDEKGKLILVDSEGYPTTNITGTYTMPRDRLKNSFLFMEEVSPLRGRKIVFATYPSSGFTKVKIEKALKELKMPLKEFKEFINIEDYEEFVKKYNNDKEVGWIISGEKIARKRDGTPYTFDEFHKWERENVKKPNLGFWEESVRGSALCALALDSVGTLSQVIDMVDRIAKGENQKKIKPEDPQKSLIIVNKARAKDLNIQIPEPVMKAAWRTYIDYNGNYVERK